MLSHHAQHWRLFYFHHFRRACAGICPALAAARSYVSLNHAAELALARLSAIRTEGDWEGWVSFFLEGVAVAALDAERNIVDMPA